MARTVKSAIWALGVVLFLALVYNLYAAAQRDQAAFGLNGSITIMGSTAMQPLVEQAANQFIAANPRARILVQGGGSGTGLTQVYQGSVQIGNSDIFADEKAGIDPTALVDHKIAVVGFAVVVNKAVTIDNLTQDQLIDIFTGKVTNWQAVGGPDLPIVLLNRPKSSGTRAAFHKYGLKGAEEANGMALTEDSSGTVRRTIADTKGAISYLALPYLNDTVKTLKLNGVEATKENIVSGKYPIWSYEHMYTKGPATNLTKAFIDYMLSPSVQNTLVVQIGYIPIKAMQVTR